MIITIDGPAGSGKSTAARKLAAALGISFLDTGATYRAVTLKALREGADFHNEHALAELARRTDIDLRPQPDGTQVLLDGEDVSSDIRSDEVSRMSYLIARCGRVRKILVDLQRLIGARLGDFVAEGRDQGSVVFPDADLKFYMDASPEVRARRRFDELHADGEEVSYEQVLSGIIERDGRDRNRAVAPLVKPAQAIVIDTSGDTIDQVVEKLLSHVRQVRK